MSAVQRCVFIAFKHLTYPTEIFPTETHKYLILSPLRLLPGDWMSLNTQLFLYQPLNTTTDGKIVLQAASFSFSLQVNSFPGWRFRLKKLNTPSYLSTWAASQQSLPPEYMIFCENSTKTASIVTQNPFLIISAEAAISVALGTKWYW